MPLFGTPQGFLAAEDQANKTALSQVQAQKLLGEIEQQPAETELRRAQARHYDAETGKLNAANMDLAAMAGWEAAARAATEAVPATEGREANVADVSRFKPASVTEPLRKLFDVMTKGGAPSRLTAPIAKQIAEISEKESIGAYRMGQAAKLSEEQQSAAWDRIGSVLNAAIESPQGYAQARMLVNQAGNMPPEAKKILDNLPADWESGRKFLQPYVTATLKAKDAIAIKQKERQIAEKAALDATTKAKNNAQAAVAGARLDLVREQTTVLKKLGGEGTPTQIAAGETRTAAQLQKMQTDQLKVSPYAPVDPSKAVAGRTYTFKDGRVARAMVGPDGKIGWELVQGTKPWKDIPVPRSAAEIRAAALAGGDDEDED